MGLFTRAGNEHISLSTPLRDVDICRFAEEISEILILSISSSFLF
jgi:hypothetical protein